MSTMPRTIRQLLRAVALCALAVSAIGCAAPEEAPPAHNGRNVVLVTLDGLRQDHLSAFGYHRQTTPNIDWLAERGLSFRNVIPSGCSTKTSLTSLFTSMSFPGHQIWRHGEILPDTYPTLAESFKAAGYRTLGYVATPHLAAELNYGQGFDRYEDFTEEDLGYVKVKVVNRYLVQDLAALEAGDAPFFLYVHYEEPHPPWIYRSPWLDQREPEWVFFPRRGCAYIPSQEELETVDEGLRHNLIAKYDAAIQRADQGIGEILDSLRQKELLENTVVAVATDHGLELLERYSAGHGFNLFDEVVRGFLILYDGAEALKPRDTDQIQGRIFDIGPTLLSRGGIRPPDSIDGRDLLSENPELPEFAFTQCYNGESVRSLRHKLVHFDFSRQLARDRLPPHGLPEGLQLFDLTADPGETTDVQAEQPQELERLKRALLAYSRDLRSQPHRAEVKEDADLTEAARERLKALGYIE